jgi:adenine-specific DNA-methyltransferase
MNTYLVGSNPDWRMDYQTWLTLRPADVPSERCETAETQIPAAANLPSPFSSPNARDQRSNLTTVHQLDAFIAARREARVLAERAGSNRRDFAVSFVAAALLRYCPNAPEYPGRMRPHPLADELAARAADLDDDIAAYLLSTVYTAMLPPDYRAQHGVFYTPPSASDRLISMAEMAGVSWRTARVTDISCGGGAFLAPVARRILATQTWPSDVEAARHLRLHVRGFERDPFGAWMSEVFLAATFRRMFPRTRCVVRVVDTCDSLGKPEHEFERYDLVIGNPPFGRLKLGSAMRARFERSLFGHANLYGLFTDLAVRLVKPSGVIAYVTPASFLGGEYFKKLRAVLATHAPPCSIDFLTSRDGVFADVLQETVLVTYRPGMRRSFPISFTTLSETGPAVVRHAGIGSLPAAASRPWLLPRSPEHGALISVAKTFEHRLDDYGYEVCTGPLVWNRHKTRLGNTRRATSVPIIWAEAINPSANGKFRLKSEARNHAKWYVPQTIDPNVVEGECVLVQRTTSKEQKRRIVAAPLPRQFLRVFPRVAVENHLNMVRPCLGRTPVVSTSTLAALLNSDTIDQLFRCINGSTAVSAYELESIPLPDPKQIVPLVEMVRRKASRDEIDAFVSSLYANVRIGAAA